ncbi:DUF6221 family protein [Streptomyces sp. NPDC059441]|uniref:DUF6221 family protein n=1 Tax=Streptomyces sp. NPDC059441 TaxID=3346829 RepID=UPI0036795B9A
MPDLHGWITQQIDKVEATARDATEGPWHVDEPTERWEAYRDHQLIGSGKPIATLNSEYNGPLNADHIALHSPDYVLRRCTADRKILARHTLNPDVHYEPACKGCGTYGDMELSEVDNLNECPELLDLGYAHGLTPEILATLDQPETPARPERPDIPPPVHLNALVRLLSARPTSSVPPALRGPNWKARP